MSKTTLVYAQIKAPAAKGNYEISGEYYFNGMKNATKIMAMEI